MKAMIPGRASHVPSQQMLEAAKKKVLRYLEDQEKMLGRSP